MEDAIEIERDWKDFIPVYGIFNHRRREAEAVKESVYEGNLGDVRRDYFGKVYWTQAAYGITIGLASGYGIVEGVKSLTDLL